MTFPDLTQVLIGPDVSNVNKRPLDASLLLQQKMGFGIYKVGQGLIANDPGKFTATGLDVLAQANDAALITAALPRTRYFFLERESGRAQAERFFGLTNELGNPQHVGHGVDIELQDRAGHHPTFQDVLDFLTRWRELTDLKLGGYSGRWFWHGYFGDPAWPAFDWLWDGGTYVTDPNSTTDPWQVLQTGGSDGEGVTPGYWNKFGGQQTYDLRQYKSTVSIGGIQPCDVSVFPGTTDDLVKLWGIDQSSPAPIPAPQPTPQPQPAPTPAPQPVPINGGWNVTVQNIDLRNANSVPVRDNGRNGVKALQALLQAAGYDCGCVRGVPDGIAGVRTRASLGGYQSRAGLAVDYIAGQNTFNHLVTL